MGGRGSGRRRGFGLSLPRWHSRAARLHEVALPCDFRPQNRTNLPPRGQTTPENARNCHLDRQPRHPGHEVAFPCGPTSRGGTPVRFQTPKPHKPATSRAEHPQNRTNLPPRGRGTPENARNCHLAGGAHPKTHETATSTRKPTTPAPRSAPLGGGCRIRRSFQSLGGGSAPTYWRSTAPDRVTATQCRAGRGNQPRPRATTEAPRRHRCPGPPPKPRKHSRFPRCSPETLPARSATQPPTAHPHRTGPTPRHEPEVDPGAPPPNPARRPRPEHNGKVT